MNGNLTDITVVLDRSGSMASVAKDVVGGFNKFVEEQKKAKGSATFTLIQFDTEYEFVHRSVDIQKVSKLEFQPRGCTALLDAMGEAIVDTGERLKNMRECDRPSKVIFVIITDGQENASKEYKKYQINEMIKLQREVYGWEFVFLAANQDAIGEAHSLGISANTAMNYKHSSHGYDVIFCSVSSNLSALRRGEACNMAFSAKDRADAVSDTK